MRFGAMGARGGFGGMGTALGTASTTPYVPPYVEGSQPLAYGSRVALWGDSIVQQNDQGFQSTGDSTTGAARSNSIGEMTQAQSLDPRFRWENFYDTSRALGLTVGANNGINGQSSTQIANRVVSDVGTILPDVAILNMGTNNTQQIATIIGNGLTSDIGRSIAACLAAGSKVIVGTIRPNSSANESVSRAKADIQAINAAIRSYVAGLANANVILWDAYKRLDNGTGYINASWTYDGLLHPNAIGAEQSVWGPNATASQYSLIEAIRTFIRPGNVLTDIVTANTNQLPNNNFVTATGGVNGDSSVISGTIPGSMKISFQGTKPVSTLVSSTVANAGTGGNSWVLTITAGGSSTFERFQLLPSATNITQVLTPGTYYRTFAEIETDGANWIGPMNVNSTELDTGVTTASVIAMVPDSNLPDLALAAPRRKFIMSNPVAVKSMTQFQPYISLPILPAQTTAGAVTVVKVHRWWWAPVTNTRTDWHV